MESLTDEGADQLSGKRVAFVGKLGGLTRREAMQLIRQHGGYPVEQDAAEVDWVIIGADQLPADVQALMERASLRALEAEGSVEIMPESEFWQRMGLVEPQHHVKQLYTPAMLADLLGISVGTVRRWHRLALIQPAQVVHRLPYFDFQEVQTARQLATWIEHGAKPAEIKKQLAEFARWLPANNRSLDQLDIILEGRQLLLRRGEGLVESGGQRWINFEAFEPTHAEVEDSPSILSLAAHQSEWEEPTAAAEAHLSQATMLSRALMLEAEGRLREAIEWYRVVLTKFGPTAELHFQLAELLYREGEVEAARERYYAAIEMEDDFVEARANLGCVLHETGRPDLAIAAFRGALVLYEDYADVHYHLARVLDEVGHRADAVQHWQRFVELAPQSPWIEEAQQRLEES